jgi:hypothetical protein
MAVARAMLTTAMTSRIAYRDDYERYYYNKDQEFFVHSPNSPLNLVLANIGIGSLCIYFR